MLQRFFKLREHQDVPKPFLEHLEELRWMLMKMVTTVGIFMICSFAFRHALVQIVQRPLYAVDPELVAGLRTLGVTDSLTISLQLAFYAGMVLSFPLLLYFLAQFVLPALTRQEKKYLWPAIAVGFGLFLAGVTFCYYVVLPETLAFFFNDARSLDWTPMWTVREYFSFVTQITLAFGLAFELPVAVMALVHLGFVSFEFLNRTRPYAVVLILFLAIIIAPTPDVLTFLALGAPMVLLYEGCIWLAWLLERRAKKARLADEAR